jgi:gamma-glutamyl:cysteine ligase YbdK (ATP-grasp superfamily)
MGQDIKHTEFTQADYSNFYERIVSQLNDFEQAVHTPGFGNGATTIGAELELYLINRQFQPSPCNMAVIDEYGSNQLDLELNQYNLEYNSKPVNAKGTPFSQLGAEFKQAFSDLNAIADKHDSQVLAIGILPTLSHSSLTPDVITPKKRYYALAKGLKQLRGNAFHIDIKGDDHLEMDWDEVTFEGANTSFQLHWRVSPDEFADAFNAVQLATPLALAVSSNSPLFLGKRLWQETRIALFMQSIDYRGLDMAKQSRPPRVHYGQGWVRRGAYELFAESVALFPPLMPILFDEETKRRNPGLDELRLHQGSVWTWNRPIYDRRNKGHLRIEMRALPAGPSIIDMQANAAYLIGLANGLKHRVKYLLPSLPFEYCRRNFYNAAKYGLNAEILWPDSKVPALNTEYAWSIIEASLRIAEEGLQDLGVDSQEIRKMLDIIGNRVIYRRTGSTWQLSQLQQLMNQPALKPESALTRLVKYYAENQASNKPVHSWEVFR